MVKAGVQPFRYLHHARIGAILADDSVLVFQRWRGTDFQAALGEAARVVREDRAFAAVGVDGVMRLPPRVIAVQDETVPGFVFRAGMALSFAVLVFPVRAVTAGLALLLVAARLIAAVQVGVVDDAAAPVTSAVVLPAVFGDDGVEVAAELA